jgi:DNA-binding response OmpR family regulator
MRMLLVEDDRPLSDAVAEALGIAGFQVEVLDRAEPADAVLSCTAYDLLILDIGLPGMNGLELLHRLRQRGNRIPVMMLTARDSLQDRVRGLNEGADDYLVKPFQLPELVARGHALIRRGRVATGAVLVFGPLAMDTGLRQALLHGEELPLTGREWDLLVQLVLAAPNVVAKAKLIDGLSGWDSEITANAIEIYASRLRAKLAERGLALRTVRGLGYRLETAPVAHA